MLSVCCNSINPTKPILQLDVLLLSSTNSMLFVLQETSSKGWKSLCTPYLSKQNILFLYLPECGIYIFTMNCLIMQFHQ